MIWDWLLELKNNIDRHGVRWGVFFALFAVYRKERRNFKLDQRDEAMFHNQYVIMTKLGVSDQWHGPPKISNYEEVQNSKKRFLSLLADMRRENQSRRGKRMQNINWATLAPGIVAAVKLVTQAFGIEIPDEHINSAINGAAALCTIIAIVMSHQKKGAAANGSDYTPSANK